jgi:chromosome segregation ATPase
MQSVTLRKRLFGYHPGQVHQLLLDRDNLLGLARERIGVTEREVERVKAELSAARLGLSSKDRLISELQGEIGDMRGQLDELRSEIESARREAREQLEAPTGILTQIVTAEIAPLLAAAQEAAARVVEDAQQTMNEQLARADGARSELAAQVEDIVAWHQRVDPLFGAIRARMAQTRDRIDDVPNRIAEALAPLAELVGSMSDQLETLLSASSPPVFSSDIADRVVQRWQARTDTHGPATDLMMAHGLDEDTVVLDARVDLEFAESW